MEVEVEWGWAGARGRWSLTNLASFPGVGWDQMKRAAPSVSIFCRLRFASASVSLSLLSIHSSSCLCLRGSVSVFASRLCPSLWLLLALSNLPSVFISLSFTITVHFPLSLCLTVSFFSHPLSLPLPLSPSHPAGQRGLWWEPDIYSRGSFISTVSLFTQRAGGQINKTAERMQLLRILFSLQA